MDLEASFSCQGCGAKLTVKLKEMYPGNSVTCACGAKANFTGDDMREAQAALDKLTRQLERLGAKRTR